MDDGRPLTLTLSPPVGRGNTPSPATAGEGWGEGGHEIKSTLVTSRRVGPKLWKAQ
jgi:hypothetical protein